MIALAHFLLLVCNFGYSTDLTAINRFKKGTARTVPEVHMKTIKKGVRNDKIYHFDAQVGESHP